VYLPWQLVHLICIDTNLFKQTKSSIGDKTSSMKMIAMEGSVGNVKPENKTKNKQKNCSN